MNVFYTETFEGKSSKTFIFVLKLSIITIVFFLQVAYKDKASLEKKVVEMEREVSMINKMNAKQSSSPKLNVLRY